MNLNPHIRAAERSHANAKLRYKKILEIPRRPAAFWQVLIFLGLSQFFLGCAQVTRFETPGVVAHAEQLDGSDEPLYYSIAIDIHKAQKSEMPDIRLKFDDNGSSFALSELTPSIVSRYLPPFEAPPQWPKSWKEKAAKEDAYEGAGYYIKFEKGAAVFVGLCSHCAGGRASPVVGNKEDTHFYTLPLTERQMTEIFGPPRKRSKANEVYY